MGIKLENLVYVSATKMLISGSDFEKKLILREWPLKLCIVKCHTFLDK